MAVLGADWPTLADVARRTHDGQIQTIAEMLAETNEILEDIPFLPGNMETGHKGTIRTGLPEVAWRILNRGVPPSKSRTMQVVDTCGMLEAYAQVEKDLAMLNGNTPEWRLSEDRAFIQSMNHEFSDTLFYGNTAVNPEEFLGLTPRFSDLTADNGVMIGDGGGAWNAGTLTSIWLVCWGPNTIHGIFPKGSNAGLQYQDLGEVTAHDEDNYMFQALRSHYQWKAGLHMRDWRYVARLANIDHSLLTFNALAGTDLITAMVHMLERVQDLNLGRPVFYCGRRVKTFLRLQTTQRNNVNITMDQVAGKPALQFDGVPVRLCEALNMAEDGIRDAGSGGAGDFTWPN
jgi:hypothetical protein